MGLRSALSLCSLAAVLAAAPPKRSLRAAPPKAKQANLIEKAEALMAEHRLAMAANKTGRALQSAPYNYAAIYASGFSSRYTSTNPTDEYSSAWQTNNQALGYGLAVSEDGKTLLASAPTYNFVQVGKRMGKAYAMSGIDDSLTPSNTGLLSNANWEIASEGETAANFGYDVSMSEDGNYVAVSEVPVNSGDGVDDDYLNTQFNSLPTGVVIFKNVKNWAAKESEIIKDPAAGLTSSGFGMAISMASNAKHLAVGAPLLGYGAVYIYKSDDGFYGGTPIVVSSPLAAAGASFGACVFIDSGNRLVVGAGNLGGHGYVYVYHRSESTFVLHDTLTAQTPTTNDYFGWYSLSARESGSQLILAVGMPGVGGAEVFECSKKLPCERKASLPFTVIVGDGLNFHVGDAVAISKDGRTLAVSGYANYEGGPWSGTVAIFKRTALGSTWTYDNVQSEWGYGFGWFDKSLFEDPVVGGTNGWVNFLGAVSYANVKMSEDGKTIVLSTALDATACGTYYDPYPIFPECNNGGISALTVFTLNDEDGDSDSD